MSVRRGPLAIALLRIALLRIVLLGIVLLGIVASAPAAPALAAARYTRLSDEWTLTRVATPWHGVAARRAPGRGAPIAGRVRAMTEDGRPEVLVVLGAWRDRTGARWLRVRIPSRPNGRTGWLPRAAVASIRTVHTALRIDRRALRVTLYRRGRAAWSAPVGIGARRSPTPRGRFWIRERLRVAGQPLYGPWAFGTSAYSRLTDWPGGGVIGLHGTDRPGLIPGRPSHGCVRLRNRDITWLAHGRLPIGTPVRIV